MSRFSHLTLLSRRKGSRVVTMQRGRTNLKMSPPFLNRRAHRIRRARAVSLTLAVFGTLVVLGSAEAQMTPDAVRASIRKGVQYLKKRQRPDGSWKDHSKFRSGVTSLCTLALLNSGVGTDDPSIQRSLAYLRRVGNPESTYATSLQTMVFCAAMPATDLALIRRNAEWLEAAQTKSGGWAYHAAPTGADLSNSQFALLALHEAKRLGVPVQSQTWSDAAKYWRKRQLADGSWGYQSSPGSGSMTCAGIASTIIATHNARRGDAHVRNGVVFCCSRSNGDKSVQRGLDWLGRNFSVSRNPQVDTTSPSRWRYYFLYGLERVGRMSGNRFIGQHDWYREGVEVLLESQEFTGAWQGGLPLRNPEIGTPMALLFLAKGRRPVVISKLQHSKNNDWNRHRSDIGNLTRYVESRWGIDMTWQTIDVRSASVADLMQTPVLFISGKDDLRLSAKARQRLREYVNHGGFIFAEACCDSPDFDRQFRALIEELFPDSPLRPLPPNHPIWYAEQRVNADYLRPLFGLDSCCRTSVVYCPQNLGCYWELAQGSTLAYPADVRGQIEAALAMGANVLAYATGRELRDKLEIPPVAVESDMADAIDRGSLQIAKLQHAGGSDDAPAALPNLLRVFQNQLKLPVKVTRQLVSPAEPKLPDFPIVFLHGRREFTFSDRERTALRKYLENGGFAFGDAICASESFANAFRREFELVLPHAKFRRLPADHPLFSKDFRGHDVRQVRLRSPESRQANEPWNASVNRVSPALEALTLDERIVVLLSPNDISCALENSASLDCTGYVREDAANLGVNVILFALQQ